MRTKSKNTMRTPEDKEQLVLDFFNSGIPYRAFADMHGIYHSVFWSWISKYRKSGIEGLKSQTGKGHHKGSGNVYCGLMRKKNKTREEELEIENLKLKVENARLKKGYLVKGVGSKKEFVTTKDLNMKS